MKKKFLIILMVFILFFSSFLFPARKTEAIAPLIPAVANPAVATWILNTLVTTGAVSVAAYNGIKHYDDIKNTIEGVKTVVSQQWESVSDNIKQDLYTSIQNAKDGIVTLSDTVINWFQDVFVDDVAENAVYTVDIPFSGKVTDSCNFSKSYDVISDTPITIYAYVNNRGFQTVTFDYADNNCRNWFSAYLNGQFVAQFHSDELNAALKAIYYGSTSLLTIPTLDKNIDNYAEQVGKNLENVFNRVRDKGISLPPTIIGGLATGGSILWSPDIGEWVHGDQIFDGEGNLLKDAGDVYDGDFSDVTDWTVPDVVFPTDVTGDVLIGEDGIPISGTKAIDIPDIVSIPSTDVIRDVPVSDVPALPNSKKINWKRLGTAIGDLSKVFPFSLPWDIKNAFNALFPSQIDEFPKFEYTLKLFDNEYTFDVEIPEMFYDWTQYIRIFLLFLFDIGMIYAIYRFFGGQT